MTVALIHGGGTTARFWDRLPPHLDAESVAVDCPGAGAGSITLVAHSSGGLLVPGVVAALEGRVHGIVLNAALVPVEGGCGIDCMQERHRHGLRLAVESAARDGRTITLPPPADPEASRRAYGGDPLDDAALAFVLDPARSVEDTVHHYFQPVHWSAAAGVPITYVLNERDRPIRPEMQQVMVQRLPPPVEVIRLDSGHLLPVTSPALFAEIINRIAG